MIIHINVYEDPEIPLSGSDKDAIEEGICAALDGADVRYDYETTDD